MVTHTTPTYEELVIENEYLKQVLRVTEHAFQQAGKIITGGKK